MKKYYLVLLIGVIAISFAAVFIRLTDAPPIIIAAFRMAIATLLFIPISFNDIRYRYSSIHRRDIFIVMFAGLLLALHFALWITSLKYTSVASSVILVTSHPAFVAILSYILFGEKLTWPSIIGIMTAFAGMIIINYQHFNGYSSALAGNIMALGAGFAMGGYLVIGRSLNRRLKPGLYILMVYGASAFLLIISALLMGETFIGYEPKTYLLMLSIAIIPQFIGHSCLNLSVRHLSATVVSVAILGEPVGASALAWLILGSIPVIYEITGGLLVIAGIFFVAVQFYRST